MGRNAPPWPPGHPLFALGYAEATTRRPAHVMGADAEPAEVCVAEEIPVAIAFNARPHAVMMATPADLEDFVVGFALTEQIVDRASDIRGITIAKHSLGVEAQVEIDTATAERLVARGRNVVGRTGCGLCGVEMLSDALRDITPLASSISVGASALARAEAALASGQVLNRETRTMHAAAWATAQGEVVVLREDVGRHNALDKVIGALARSERDPSAGFAVVTSRASYEMVQKAALARIPLLAAVSRPTGLAIRLAEATGVALVGLLRDGAATVYADPNSILESRGALSARGGSLS